MNRLFKKLIFMILILISIISCVEDNSNILQSNKKYFDRGKLLLFSSDSIYKFLTFFFFIRL
jgi:hypothetical protein